MKIRNTILDQYGIDIDEINLLKLYKIGTAGIAAAELEQRFAEARGKWTQGLNSPNHTVAAQSKAQLAQAGTFEEILRNPQYLTALFAYYQNSGTDSQGCEFARNFFTALKGAKKTIRQKDYNFFMQYFREERKSEKAILEMLKTEFRAVTLKAAPPEEVEGKQTQKRNPFGVAQTRFHKDSLCLLHKSETQYAVLQESRFLQEKYPRLSGSMFDFLSAETKNADDFAIYIDGALQEIFAAQQNDYANSGEYIPLSDFYTTWQDLLQQADVTGNFPAFKCLIRYPKLTPYLYLAEAFDIPYAEVLADLFRDEYGFSDLEDFLFRYLKPLADGRHFRFTVDKKLATRLKETEKNPETSEQDTLRRSEASKQRQSLPLLLKILRFLATWPVYVMQVLFESFRFIVLHIQNLYWIIMLFFTFLLAHYLNNTSLTISFVDVVIDFVTYFHGNVEDLVYSITGTYVFGNVSFALGSVLLIVRFVFQFLFLPAMITLFLVVLAQELDRNIDLMALHQIFQEIQYNIDRLVLNHYKKLGHGIYIRMILPILTNILTIAAIVFVIWLILFLVNHSGSSMILAAVI